MPFSAPTHTCCQPSTMKKESRHFPLQSYCPAVVLFSTCTHVGHQSSSNIAAQEGNPCLSSKRPNQKKPALHEAKQAFGSDVTVR